jgi:hypothetical protein
MSAQAIKPDRHQQDKHSSPHGNLLSSSHFGCSTTIEYPAMTLKNAALLAFIGTTLMTALLLWEFVLTFLNVLRGLLPVVTLFSSFIHAFGCFSVALFFYVFHRKQ